MDYWGEIAKDLFKNFVNNHSDYNDYAYEEMGVFLQVAHRRRFYQNIKDLERQTEIVLDSK